MKKKTLQLFHPSSAEYVIAHAAYRSARGRKPSVSFAGVNNPREALVAAKRELADMRQDGYWLVRTIQQVTPQNEEAVCRALGIEERGVITTTPQIPSSPDSA